MLRKGNLLYLPTETGLQILQTTADPTQVTPLGQVETPRPLLSVDLDPSGLLIGGGIYFVGAFDVTNPQNPALVDLVPLPSGVRRIVCYGSRIYTACGELGIRVLSHP